MARRTIRRRMTKRGKMTKRRSTRGGGNSSRRKLASGHYGFEGDLVELGEHGFVRDSARLRKGKAAEAAEEVFSGFKEPNQEYMNSAERKKKQKTRGVGNRKYFG